MADASAKTLKTLEKHPSCYSLICNIYEHDKLLLDCFENFYNSKKRVITIYRLLKDEFLQHRVILCVPSCHFFIAQVCLGDHCTSFTVCGWWYSICFHSLVLKALTTKKTHGTSLQKGLVGVSDAIYSLKQNQALWLAPFQEKRGAD